MTVTDAAYQARLMEALAALRRATAQGSPFTLACDNCAREWRVSFRDLEAVSRATVQQVSSEGNSMRVLAARSEP